MANTCGDRDTATCKVKINMIIQLVPSENDLQCAIIDPFVVVGNTLLFVCVVPSLNGRVPFNLREGERDKRGADKTEVD